MKVLPAPQTRPLRLATPTLRRVGALLLVLGATACAGEDEPPPVCDSLESGIYLARGPGFGMPMEVTVTFFPERCEFEFSLWDMNHAVESSGGRIDGRTVQLLGSSYWESCIGELSEDGRGASGECGDSIRPDGGDFHLEWRREER